MNNKVKWLRDKISMQNMQGMIISNPVNIKYLTGIDAEGVLLITRKENFFLTDARYLEHAQSVLTINDGIIVNDVSNITRDDYENFFLFCETVGFEENYITYATYKKYLERYKIHNFEETEYMIEKQRMIKDEEEIELIEAACALTDECFKHICDYIKIGMTEKEIAFEIEKFFKENGADGLAFDTIVASGKNSSKPHAIPTDKKVESGDPITIDMGCKYKGYCSDMTRTIFAGYMPVQVQKVYDLVLKNQLQTLKEIKDGANIRTITKMVENDFKINGYNLVHALGHGVGLEVHEMPNISSRNDMLLKNNMIITNEPGIYITGYFGVRIEDTVQVTKSGCINLTKSDKNYIIVDQQERLDFNNKTW